MPPKWYLKMADLSRLLFFFLVVPIFLVREVSTITNHTVGDQSGWTTGVDYSSWAAGKTFFVDDFLDQRPLNTGNDFVPLTLPGFKWFISTIGHDCKSGQKLIISVENPPPPASVPQFAHPLSTLPSALVPALPIPMPPAPSPSAQSPAQNQTTPQLPIVPAPSQNIPPSHLPGPSATAPPPSGAAAKSPVSAYLGVSVVVAANCTVPADQTPFSTGNDPIFLAKSGKKWYICGKEGHCGQSQKLVITVMDMAPANSPAPPPPSAATKAILSGQIGFVVVVVAILGMMIA
ncbi:hypothetical protein SDJN02_22041, partial [Cucurbita argyrosperma subsp. argyrosperma]